ncbi:MAG: hypothetical protein LBM17_07040 [Candidatus Accumulibacter sp.]|jgi:hypothetical protein|nr:hypothetical protein [Accumulibacter sp.]
MKKFSRFSLGPVVLFAFFPLCALAQPLTFYCMKDGHKIITDQPCASLSASQEEVKRGADYPPLSTIEGGLTDYEKQLLRQHDSRVAAQNQVWENQREEENSIEEHAAKTKESQCNALVAEKKFLQQRQRYLSDAYDAERFQIINKKYWDLKCAFR